MEASFPKRYDIKFFLSVFVLRLSILKFLSYGVCNQKMYIFDMSLENDNILSKTPRFQWTTADHGHSGQ